MKKILKVIFLSILVISGAVTAVVVIVSSLLEENPPVLTYEEKVQLLDSTAKEYFGENTVFVQELDDEIRIYRLTGLSGDLEPIYIWRKMLVTASENNLVSQQKKRDAVDFWHEKEREVYYVNKMTGESEILSDDINSMERVFEDEWHLKIECKSQQDIEFLAKELTEWEAFSSRESPYQERYSGDTSKGKANRSVYGMVEIMYQEEQKFDLSLSYFYKQSKMKDQSKTFEELISEEIKKYFDIWNDK